MWLIFNITIIIALFPLDWRQGNWIDFFTMPIIDIYVYI